MKILKICVATLLTLVMLASSLVFVNAVSYEDGDVILNELMIDSSAEIAENLRDRTGSATLSWNGETGRLHIKAGGNGAIELVNYLPTKDDAFTFSADIYVKGGVGTSTTQGRVGLGIYSDILTSNDNNNKVGWCTGLYTWIGMDSGWGNDKSAVQYNEGGSTASVGFTNTNGYVKNLEYTGAQLKNYAQCISFKVVVDPTATAKVSAYFNGKLVSTVSNEITDNVAKGNLFFYVRNTEFEIDNLKVVAGATDTVNPLYDIEQSKYKDGAIVINEDIIAAKAAADGNTSGLFETNTDLKWDGEKLVFTPEHGKNVIRKLDLFPEYIDTYTISVDIRITDTGEVATDTTKIVQLGMGDISSWANGINMQFQAKGVSGDTAGTEAKVYVANKRANGIGGTGSAANITYNGGSYIWGTYLNLTIKVGAENAEFFMNGSRVADIAKTKLLAAHGAPWFGARGGMTVNFDNLMVYTGTGDAPMADTEKVGIDDNIRYYGHQRTTAAGATYGLRFVAEAATVEGYSALGFKVEVRSSADGNASVIKSFDKNGAVAYRQVRGNVNGTEKTYTPNTGYTVLFALIINDIQAVSGVTYTYTVTPYAVTAEGDKVYYAPYEIQYDGSSVPIDRA